MRIGVWALVVAGAAAVGQPVVNTGGVLNVASYALPGLPNAAIGQGSIFAIFGTGLGPAAGVKVYAFPLNPDGFQGTAVTVTVNGTAAKAPVLYTSASQVNALMPSGAPIGSGTLTVSYNGQTSASVPVEVAASGFGIFAANQAGSGLGVITNTGYQALGLTAAAEAGDSVILWGTGLGAVSGDENAGPLPGNMPQAGAKVYVGGVEVSPEYAGRSGCCAGLDQIVFQAPAGVTGCAVPVAVVMNGVLSNFVTAPIAAGGRVCSDAAGYSAAEIAGFAQAGTAAIGTITLERQMVTNDPNGTSGDLAAGYFWRFRYADFVQNETANASAIDGACVVNTYRSPNNGYSPNVTFSVMNAGPELTISGPGGTEKIPVDAFGYEAFLGGALVAPENPLYFGTGTYSVSNGRGGGTIGPFTAAAGFQAGFTWTNEAAIGTVTRAQGLTVTWTGAEAGATVLIDGNSGAGPDTDHLIGAEFVCSAAGAAGTFTVPAEILMALPQTAVFGQGAGQVTEGKLRVIAISAPVGFSASGMDVGTIGTTINLVEGMRYQ